MWKGCGLFFCVSIVLLSVVITLWQKNGMLKDQNCILKKELEVNIEATKKKAERDKEELLQLSRELSFMAEYDPAWSDTPLPGTIAKQLRRLIKDHKCTISAATRAENSL